MIKLIIKSLILLIVICCTVDIVDSKVILPLYQDDGQIEYQKTHGIDISRYQGKINYLELTNDPEVDFVICKATEGGDLIDPTFHLHWVSLRKYKYVRQGAYHFFRPNVSGRLQAKLYISQVKLSKGDIIPIIDVEYVKRWRKIKGSGVVELNIMCKELEKYYGVKPMIYTSSNFWNKYVAKGFLNKDLVLWVADWRQRDTPQLPKSFKEHVMWQNSNKGIVKGISKRVDKNVCNDLQKILIK